MAAAEALRVESAAVLMAVAATAAGVVVGEVVPLEAAPLGAGA